MPINQASAFKSSAPAVTQAKAPRAPKAESSAPVPRLTPSEARERLSVHPEGRADKIHVNLFAFGGTKALVGKSELQYSMAGPCTASEFLDQVCESYPQLAPQRSALRLAVNGEYVGNAHKLGMGDQVALIPPVAGG